MKRKRSMTTDAIGLTTAGFALGVGGSLPGAGASTAAMGSMLPMVGTAMGGSYALGSMMNMVPKKRRK